MFLADVPALGTRTYSLELVDVAPKDVITNPVPGTNLTFLISPYFCISQIAKLFLLFQFLRVSLS
jgi:hypothetical protein